MGLSRLEHPFYVSEWSDGEARPKPIGHKDLNSHWVGAGHLKVGDKIRKADGTFGVVSNVTTVQETRTMYNLEVQEAHTFFVGTQGWLVHNCSLPDPFEIAKNGGRNAGWYKDMLSKSDRELEKSIRSLDKQIAEHESYIADPRSKIPHWDTLDPRQQRGLLESKWPGDTARQQEHKSILEGILRERGKR